MEGAPPAAKRARREPAPAGGSTPPPPPTPPRATAIPEGYSYSAAAVALAATGTTSAPATFYRGGGAGEAGEEATMEEELALFSASIQEDLERVEQVVQDVDADIYGARWEAEEEEEEALEQRLASIRQRVQAHRDRSAVAVPTASATTAATTTTTTTKSASLESDQAPRPAGRTASKQQGGAFPEPTRTPRPSMYAKAGQDDLALLFSEAE